MRTAASGSSYHQRAIRSSGLPAVLPVLPAHAPACPATAVGRNARRLPRRVANDFRGVGSGGNSATAGGRSSARQIVERFDQCRRIVVRDLDRNGALHPTGLVVHRVSRGRFDVGQQNRRDDQHQQQHRHQQQAHPEAACADVVQVFARRDEPRLGWLNAHRHRRPRERKFRATTLRAYRICESSTAASGAPEFVVCRHPGRG